MGPRILPWGTPEWIIELVVENCLKILTFTVVIMATAQPKCYFNVEGFLIKKYIDCSILCFVDRASRFSSCK